nr:TadE family protein [Bradyrhizobium sacchari]
MRLSAYEILADGSGLAATEFAVVVPLMLVMFFGTVEFSSAVAIDRKVTLVARTLSDLTSQSTSLGDADITNFFAASTGIMTPYATTPVLATITELYVDPSRTAPSNTKKGRALRTTFSVAFTCSFELIRTEGPSAQAERRLSAADLPDRRSATIS